MTRKTKPSLTELMKTKETAQALLLSSGIHIYCSMSIKDSGPEMEIQVDPDKYVLAIRILSFLMDSATIKLVKRKK